MKKGILVAFFGIVFLLMVAPMVFAVETTPTTEVNAAPSPINWKPISASLAVGLSALASGWAQAKIGAAAAGALAEKPELAGIMIVLEAIPETMIILGFVVALLILIMG